MSSKHNKEFGFDILTETIEQNDDSYEIGNSTKQHDKQHTDDALILQSILKYSIEFGTDSYFKSRKLSENYLLGNCDYYIRAYEGSKVKYKARPESINTRVVNTLEKLAYLELVEPRPSEAKNHEPTEEYAFTKLGRLIGLLLSWYTDEPSIALHDEIFFQCIQLYKSMNHSHALFCVIFLKSCFVEKKFHIIMNSLIHWLENASPDDKHEFLNQIKFLETFYNDLELFNIYKSSFQELYFRDNSKYQMELYNLKLEIEELHESKLIYLKDFEVLRYKVKQDINKAVLSAYCNACKNHIVITWDTLEYLELCVKSFISEKEVLDIECPFCKMDYLDFHTIYNNNGE